VKFTFHTYVFFHQEDEQIALIDCLFEFLREKESCLFQLSLLAVADVCAMAAIRGRCIDSPSLQSSGKYLIITVLSFRNGHLIAQFLEICNLFLQEDT
jgi:hypothetical protein